MNADEFRVKGKEIIDYIADYLENIRQFLITKNNILKKIQI